MIKVDVNLPIACALQIIGVPVGLNWNDQYHVCSVVLKKKNYIIRLIKESGIILLVFDNLIIFKKLFFITFIYIMFSNCTIEY